MRNSISNSQPRSWLQAMRELAHEGDVEFDREHDAVTPPRVIDAGCVLVERQAAKDIDMSGIFRMTPEEIDLALQEVAA